VLGRGLIPRGPQDDLKGKDPPVKGTKAPTRNILERKALRLALQGCAADGKDRGVAPRLHQTAAASRIQRLTPRPLRPALAARGRPTLAAAKRMGVAGARRPGPT